MPTGLFTVAPAGPAIPVMLRPKSEFIFLRIFFAINIATLPDTAPYLAIVFTGIFRIVSLDLFL